jgi:hypothetical protein
MASGDTLAVLTPLAYEPPATNYATINVRNGHPILEFDSATQETAIWTQIMPRNYAGGNITVSPRWAAVPTTGTVGWDVTFERLNDAGQDIDADGFATAQTITAATVDATSGNPKTTSVTATAGSTGTDSIAAGDLYRVRLRRDVATDTAAGDAQVLAVEIREA